MAQYLNELFNEYLDSHHLRGSSPATVKTLRNVIPRFLAENKLVLLEQLTTGVISRWLIDESKRAGRYTGEQLSPTTVFHYHKSIRGFCNWLERSEYVPVSPMKRIPNPRKPRKELVVIYTPSELTRIAEACKRPYVQNPRRDTSLIYLLLDTGVRAGEAASVSLSGVNWAERELIIQGKTGARIVPVSTKTLQKLRRYLTHERYAPPKLDVLFTTKGGMPITGRSVTEIVRRVTEAAGVESTKRGPHMFRHTFAVEYLRAGGDVFSLKRILGHSSISTTEAYIHYLATDISAKHAQVSPVRRLL